jgi:GNAT superfamily N-acetyltransferase
MVMSYFEIKKLGKEQVSKSNLRKFLFKMIKAEYGYGFIPEYHQDIVDLENYYLNPHRNNFFLAVDPQTKKIIGSLGIRAYDKDFPLFENVYNSKKTASIWRVFVDKNWRRMKVASTLVQTAEDFCRENDYQQIYLHTHRTVPGALKFWTSNGYQITNDTKNHLKTVHMEKDLHHVPSNLDSPALILQE